MSALKWPSFLGYKSACYLAHGPITMAEGRASQKPRECNAEKLTFTNLENAPAALRQRQPKTMLNALV